VALGFFVYLVMVGVGLAAGGQAPWTPWLPGHGHAGNGVRAATKVVAKHSSATVHTRPSVTRSVAQRSVTWPQPTPARTHPTPTPTHSRPAWPVVPVATTTPKPTSTPTASPRPTRQEKA
jgi:hypothetical protein